MAPTSRPLSQEEPGSWVQSHFLAQTATDTVGVSLPLGCGRPKSQEISGKIPATEALRAPQLGVPLRGHWTLSSPGPQRPGVPFPGPLPSPGPWHEGREVTRLLEMGSVRVCGLFSAAGQGLCSAPGRFWLCSQAARTDPVEMGAENPEGREDRESRESWALIPSRVL
ncbi:unnamed protein product [Rangifer tarandus platyrhynchus]|uniref:Uncharacterized protein n=1 Tax=Rangifer tarandus platyrhynchus TaxID=3082113 RepID=A0ACB1MJV2_RANTA